MTAVSFPSLLDVLREHASMQLVRRFDGFKAAPSSEMWQELELAMLRYQQLKYADPVFNDKLVDAVDHAISHVFLDGESFRDVLRDQPKIDDRVDSCDDPWPDDDI